FGRLRRGEMVEVSFAFDCWLGLDQFSVSLAVHSRDGVSYDWLDGVIFFRVTSAILVEGIANLNAGVTARRIGLRPAEFGLQNQESDAALSSAHPQPAGSRPQ
ncbi:MAG: lipopolysaccharide transport system ATP-binding protein, partial [Acidobacteriota bacterium]|nr:lipopolysaccharide transport system ATP-binding protein [Acidobacteriota bacterium]